MYYQFKGGAPDKKISDEYRLEKQIDDKEKNQEEKKFLSEVIKVMKVFYE